jgi:hypothetical protein
MKLKTFALFLLISIGFQSNAQMMETYEHVGEFGGSIGLAHYFGDLNTSGAINHPKISFGMFYRKQLNYYAGLKVNANYSFLGYSDTYSKNYYEQTRNLSFNNDVVDLSISGEFNFFKFYPELPEYRFTPYVNIGIGAMYFDPYTYYRGEKYKLRKLKTEGQNKEYSNIALIVPLGFGLKYNITDELNIFGEISYKFTNTDYLDDVSSTYSPESFSPTSIAYQLQDRSTEKVTKAIGIKGRQRGNSSQKDAYATFQIGISYNFQRYNCPKF